MCYKKEIEQSRGFRKVPKQPIILTDEIVPPPALIRAGLDALPAIVRTAPAANARAGGSFSSSPRTTREPAVHSVLHREHS
jgi:hypothetical protein